MVTTVLICLVVVLWLGLLYFFLTPWALWRRPKPRSTQQSFVGPFAAERAKRIERALKRAGVQPLPPQGHHRMGIGHPQRLS